MATPETPDLTEEISLQQRLIRSALFWDTGLDNDFCKNPPPPKPPQKTGEYSEHDGHVKYEQLEDGSWDVRFIPGTPVKVPPEAE
jgi:hypothetical protein